MPQPFPVNKLPMVNVDTLGLQRCRPMHLAAGMMAIAQHSMAEAAVSDILVAMLRAEPGPAAAIYGVIRNGKLQREALLSAGREVLEDTDRSFLDDVLRLVEGAARGRDQIAHSLWGWDDQLPADLVLIKPDHMWRMSAQAKVLNAKGGPELVEAERMQSDMRNACSVWTLTDLYDLRDRSVRAFAGTMAFIAMIKAPDSEAKSKEQTTLQTILAQAKGG